MGVRVGRECGEQNSVCISADIKTDQRSDTNSHLTLRQDVQGTTAQLPPAIKHDSIVVMESHDCVLY